MNGIWNAFSGEWEDANEPLPDIDPTWDRIRTALLALSSAVMIAAISYAWGWM